MELSPVAVVHDEGDAFVLQIALMDDRSTWLTYPKDGAQPYVFFSDKGSSWEFGFREEMSLEEFEDWAKIAIGAMRPERERRWLCQICGDKQGFGPMLPDAVWNAIAPNPHGMMCLDCMRARAPALPWLQADKRQPPEPAGAA